MSGYACPCCGEISNLFSSGGGEVMAQQLNIPFLGKVPVDVKFGELVEGKMEIASDDEDEEDDTVQEQQPPVEPDLRPLVEQYKDGWSYPRFEGFARNIIGGGA